MSRQELKNAGWIVAPSWYPVVVGIIALFCTAGANWATFGASLHDHDRRIEVIESRLDRLEDIDKRLSRIEGKLGVVP
jgi:hypothetical protein